MIQMIIQLIEMLQTSKISCNLYPIGYTIYEKEIETATKRMLEVLEDETLHNLR